MRVRHVPGAVTGAVFVGSRLRRVPRAVRGLCLRHRTIAAVTGGVLAIVPACAAVIGAGSWAATASTVHSDNVALVGGYDPKNPLVQQIGVDGSLPNAPTPLPLPADELPDGPLGIPVTALAAYRNAADILIAEQPTCHIDWALIASIGRIESNHARGGYVDAKGNTLEPILGPQLNGAGPFAAIPDSDGGKFDGDAVWDRAVGPTQFIPSTWKGYASDGNGDGESNPNNIFDAALGTGRYLCSGGLDLSKPDQLRTAVFRYNHSDTYVNTVLIWAEAYRTGVLPTPDSRVPIGAPNAGAAPPPASVPPPPVPSTPPGSVTPPSSTLPGTSTSSSSSSSKSPTTSKPPQCPAVTVTETVSSTSPTTTNTTSTKTSPPPSTCISPTTTTTTTTVTPTGTGGTRSP
ncbi:lytic murein transglycosylase [Amycolatopsis sp. QT-25]|uniref:lytic transglycosylase domain-containing protein n=1 Tax=Amycolatopsis sp. QT-25 TaxID=3034022 RepID=UPI0023EC58AE|nr:lytic murein transglycosylase [Amycolatopsis sp. QT-25]WET78596.1 lytic murein transglycosylase [Amycolatopsis sp. QT-25]